MAWLNYHWSYPENLAELVKNSMHANMADEFILLGCYNCGNIYYANPQAGVSMKLDETHASVRIFEFKEGAGQKVAQNLTSIIRKCMSLSPEEFKETKIVKPSL